MALGSIAAILAGLKLRAETIDGLRAADNFPDKVTPPMVTFGVPDVIEYDEAMGRGLDTAVFTATLYVSRADFRAGQEKLATYMTGASSLKTAIEGDRTLGGACSTLRVEQMIQPGQYDVAGTEYLGCKFTIRVWG